MKRKFEALVHEVDGKYHVTIPELDHIELVSPDKVVMAEQAKYWLSEMEDIDIESIQISFNYLDYSSSNTR